MHARAAHRAFTACAVALLSGRAAGTLPDGFSDDPVRVTCDVCLCCDRRISRERCSDSDAEFSNRAASPSEGRCAALLRLAKRAVAARHKHHRCLGRRAFSRAPPIHPSTQHGTHRL
jgi:hypothetical protein